MPQAGAHGDPVPLDFWGGFSPRTALCQRRIGRAVSRCVLEAWQVRRACRDADLAGSGCDEDEADRLVQAAQIRALSSIPEAVCRDTQASILGFLGVDEARTDIARTCRQIVPVIESGVYSPLANGIPEPSDSQRRCMAFTAAASTRLLAAANRGQTGALDRIARHRLSPSDKDGLVDRARSRTESTISRLARYVERVCGPGGFEALYGRSPETFLAALTGQADCLAGGTYAQAELVCPAAECGNILTEDGEACDDGNLTDGDGCSGSCRRE